MVWSGICVEFRASLMSSSPMRGSPALTSIAVVEILVFVMVGPVDDAIGFFDLFTPRLVWFLLTSVVR